MSFRIGENGSLVRAPVSSCGRGVSTALSGGASVDFAGGSSKPRFSLIGVAVEPPKVARTSAGTTHSAATITKMATRARLATAGEVLLDMRD